jgi:hypothetical protein
MNREVSNAVYACVATLLQYEPDRFAATMDGLAISTADLDDALGSIPRSAAIVVAWADGYLICATHSFWLLLPLAFGCDDEWPPAGVRDCRDRSARDVMGVALAA